LADKLATAQRARKRRQATNIYARITHARRDFHHKLSVRIVREFDYIAVGNVNAAALAKTRLAKSVLDAGWSSFRAMLRYKATAHGAWYEEVNESFSTRDCSSCHAKTGPKGIAELGIRSWVCAECGVSHDRDINSAQNILFRSGHRTPAEGIPAFF
jgi:IS605 OrfB family transposase